MRNHPRRNKISHDPQTPANAWVHYGVAISILTLTILIALALAPVNGLGQTSQLPYFPISLQKDGAVKGSSQSNQLLFLPSVAYPSGSTNNTYSVAVADLNGDGRVDLVVANRNEGAGDGSVGVLLGNGDGTFQPAVTYDSGATFSDFVLLADMNSDGKPDIVVVNTGGGKNSDGSVGVLMGNGDGTFGPAATYDSGGQGPVSVAVADINLDGKPDLLVANGCFGINCTSGPWVGVLMGNGDGTLQPVVTYDTGGLMPTAVIAADINGDGRPDMLVTNLYPSSVNPISVGVRLGNGDGTFQSEVFYRTGSTGGATSVAVADVNLDGKPDLLVVNYGGRVGVLLGNGDGTFQASRTYRSGGSNNGGPGLVVADVNGDGKPDLLVADYAPLNSGGALDVLLGNGDGTFEAVVSYPSGGYGAQSVAVADLNSDGKPDVVVANTDSSIFGGPGTLGVLLAKAATSTSLTSSMNPSIYGQKVTWTATVSPSGPNTPTGKVKLTWGSYTIGSATLNGSGAAILTKSNLNADSYPLTAVYAGDANNLGSTSAVLNQVVTQTTSTAALTSSPNPSAQGQAVTFTATISSPTVRPTGPVTFTAGKTVLGTAQLSGGKAMLTISSLAVGKTTVTATFNGDSNIAKSSASVTQIVQ
jgi:hypothetical protein